MREGGRCLTSENTIKRAPMHVSACVHLKHGDWYVVTRPIATQPNMCASDAITSMEAWPCMSTKGSG